MSGDPIEGQVLLLAGAKASVPPERLPDLVDRVQADLEPRLDTYRRRYECIVETADACYFLVETTHWEQLCDRLAFDERETDAVRRAHHEQLRRTGRRDGREAEFETALDLRECVVVGR